MINRFFGSTMMTRAARQGMPYSIAGGTAVAAAVGGRHEPRRARAGARIAALTATPLSWWRRRRQADEIAALGRNIRVDVGLGSSETQRRGELRFIARPDRIGWLAQGRSR